MNHEPITGPRSWRRRGTEIELMPDQIGFGTFDGNRDWMDNMIAAANAAERYRAALMQVERVGHNDDCLFCGFKDRFVYEVLGGQVPA